MCRNIRTLYNFHPPASEDEVHAASVQFVRKISGMTRVSQVNQRAFDQAVKEVARASHKLMDRLDTTAPPKNREEEVAKARARAAKRYGSQAA